MKYLLFFLFFFSLNGLFAQETRQSPAMTAADSAQFEIRRFENRLTRLREALDKNDASSLAACYVHLLGDIRSEMEQVETKTPDNERLESMKEIFAKFENFAFDPMKPDELKPYLARFDEFLALMKG